MPKKQAESAGSVPGSTGPGWPADKVEKWPISKLIPSARNARKHGDHQVAQLARMIEKFGWTNPVLVSDDGTMIAGHGRVMAAQKLGLTEVPVMVAAGWTDEQCRLYAIADNRIPLDAEWDESMLAAELRELQEIADVSFTGFDKDEIARLVIKDNEPDKIEDVSSELPGAAALKNDMAFPSKLPWGIPELRKDMLGTWPEANVTTWASDEDVLPDDGTSWYVWNWRLGSLRGMPFDRRILAFYTEDHRFSCVWDDPARWVAKMINAQFRIAIAPNFSLYSDHARVVHLWSTYRARWVGRYMQEAGIALIPDVNWSDLESLDYSLLGIPTEAPVLSVQLQTLNDKNEIAKSRIGIEEIVKRLRPGKLAVYCGPNGHKVIEQANIGCPVVFVESRTSVRRKVMEQKYETNRR